MIIHSQLLAGLWVIEAQRHEDDRGHFARTFDAEVFAKFHLPTNWAQCSTSFNARRHTLRGLHWQAAPHAEGKLVRCTRGRIYDVVADLRPASATYRHWAGLELSAENGRQLYIPEGFAHGFLTLEDATEVYYQITVPFHPESARGARWNDPAFHVKWPPADDLIISDRDKNYPDFMP